MRATEFRGNPRRATCASAQAGVAIVEFALVAILFFTLLLGIADFGRWLFTLNAASEATRLGARVAVVCDLNDTAVVDRMREIYPQLNAAQVQVTYYGSDPFVPGTWSGSCGATTCAGVTVRLQNVTIPSVAWFLPISLPIPAFTTSLTRESLRSVIDGSNNPICQ